MLVLRGRDDFTLENYRRVAWEGEAVELGPEALETIARRRAELLDLVERTPERHYYGTTTRPGEGVKRTLTDDDKRDYERHVTAPPGTYGEPLPERVARGIVLARLTNFVEGHAGVRPELAAAVAGLLDGDPLPSVPSRGNVWEVPVSSHLYGPMVDRLGGLTTKEPMALVNGCAAAAALVADVALAGQERFDLAAMTMTLAAEGVLAPAEHFAAEVGELWEDEHDRSALATMRALLEGGQSERRPYQAPVSYRIIPRALGRLVRAQALAERAARTMLHAVSDNPVFIFPSDEHPGGDIWSTGGFYPPQAIEAIDNLAFAWAELAMLAYHQGQRLGDDELALGGVPGRRGFGGMALAGLAYDVRELATPTLLPLTGSRQTDAGSMTFAAWRKATEIGRLLDMMLAGLAVLASETLSATGRPAPPAVERFLELVRSHREPNGAWETVGADVGGLADAFTARVLGQAETARV
jgi:histidine ammonia-lyase